MKAARVVIAILCAFAIPPLAYPISLIVRPPSIERRSEG